MFSYHKCLYSELSQFMPWGDREKIHVSCLLALQLHVDFKCVLMFLGSSSIHILRLLFRFLSDFTMWSVLENVTPLKINHTDGKHWILYVSIGYNRKLLETFSRLTFNLNKVSHHQKIDHSSQKHWILFVSVRLHWTPMENISKVYPQAIHFFFLPLVSAKLIISMENTGFYLWPLESIGLW